MTGAANRRRDLRSSIVDVAARLLRENGPTAVTTRGVAEAAGVQAPTLYRLFGDKDGLLEAVTEHVMGTWVAAKTLTVEAAAAADIDPVDELRAGWRTQIDFSVDNPALFGLLSDPNRVRDSPAAKSGRHILEVRVHRVAMIGRLQVAEQRAVDLIQAAGTGTIQTLLSAPPERRDPGLADAMLDAVLDQVLTDAPGDTDSGTLTQAVALRAVAPTLDVLSHAERELLIEWLDRAITAT